MVSSAQTERTGQGVFHFRLRCPKTVCLKKGRLGHIDFSGSIWYISSMLDLNSSIFWTFLMVCGLYLALTRIFFRPIGKIIDEREAKAAADSRRLQGMTELVETHTRELEKQMEEARQEAQRIREEWLKKGEDVRARALSEAKERSARVMETKMAQLEKEISDAEKTLEKEIVVFSEKIREAYL